MVIGQLDEIESRKVAIKDGGVSFEKNFGGKESRDNYGTNESMYRVWINLDNKKN